MEVLVPILFFFIILFVVVFKILNGIRKFLFSKEGREGKTATWKDFLKDLTDQVQQQMAAQKADTGEDRSVWEQLMGRQLEEKPVEAIPVPPPPPEPAKPKTSRERAPRTAPPPISKTSIGKKPPEALSAPPGLRRRFGTPSVGELRNAVIWSEILGKPVGLRDE